MKYLTKENILLAMVGFLFLVQVNDMRKSGRGPERSRGAIMERMRGMDRGDWGSRIEGMKKSRKDKAKEVAIRGCLLEALVEDHAPLKMFQDPLSLSPGVTCCDQTN